MVIEIKRTEPQKSTAAREDVQRHASFTTVDAPPRPDDKKSVVRGEAGTQAPPVDTPPKRTRAPNGTFDRTAYQREYMRDVKFAKALGMTVKQWRDRNAKS